MLALKTSKQTVTKFAFSADGARLAVGGTGRRVHLWDLTAKKLAPTLLPTFRSGPAWLGFLPDGRLFELASMGEYAIHDPDSGKTESSALRRWWVGVIVATADCSTFYGTGSQARKWTFDGRLHEVWMEDISNVLMYGTGGGVLTPAGDWLATVCNGHTRTWLHVRDAATGAIREKRLIAQSITRDLTLLPDGRTLVLIREQQHRGPVKNALMIGSVRGKFAVLAQPKEGEAEFTALALHPPGKWLAVGCADGTVRMLDTTGWREATALKWPVKPVAGLTFAPDGLKAAAGGDGGKVVVWDVDL